MVEMEETDLNLCFSVCGYYIYDLAAAAAPACGSRLYFLNVLQKCLSGCHYFCMLRCVVVVPIFYAYCSIWAENGPLICSHFLLQLSPHFLFLFWLHRQGGAGEGYRFAVPACHCPRWWSRDHLRPCWAPAIPPGSPLLGNEILGGSFMSCHLMSSCDPGTGHSRKLGSPMSFFTFQLRVSNSPMWSSLNFLSLGQFVMKW